MDVLIEEKPLLLVVWKLDGGYKICLKEPGIKFREQSGAEIILLPEMKNSVRLVAHNLWRSTTVILSLKYLKLDEKSAGALLNELQNPQGLEVMSPVPYFSRKVTHLAQRRLLTNIPRIRCNHKFNIRSQQFIFKY